LAKNNTHPSKRGTISHFPRFFRFRAALPVAKRGDAATMACVSWPRADPPIMFPLLQRHPRRSVGCMKKRQDKRPPKAHPSIPSTCKEQDMPNSNASEINSGTSGLYSSNAGIISNQQSAISNQQSAISNQQSAI
jgi:hypothetical protein